MSRIPFDDIAGQLINGLIVCPECASSDEISNVKEDEVITWKSIQESEELVFCDRCKKRL
jgi:uncharacterized protein with PIN domain